MAALSTPLPPSLTGGNSTTRQMLPFFSAGTRPGKVSDGSPPRLASAGEDVVAQIIVEVMPVVSRVFMFGAGPFHAYDGFAVFIVIRDDTARWLAHVSSMN